MRHFFSPLRRVEVDECPQCGGYWLDAGELAAIREEVQAAQQGRAAAEAYFARMVEQSLASVRGSGRNPPEQERRIKQVFRFSSTIQYKAGPR
jgi:uncharacterized protein